MREAAENNEWLSTFPYPGKRVVEFLFYYQIDLRVIYGINVHTMNAPFGILQDQRVLLIHIQLFSSLFRQSDDKTS